MISLLKTAINLRICKASNYVEGRKEERGNGRKKKRKKKRKDERSLQIQRID